MNDGEAVNRFGCADGNVWRGKRLVAVLCGEDGNVCISALNTVSDGRVIEINECFTCGRLAKGNGNGLMPAYSLKPSSGSSARRATPAVAELRASTRKTAASR